MMVIYRFKIVFHIAFFAWIFVVQVNAADPVSESCAPPSPRTERVQSLHDYYGLASGHPEKEWHAPVGVYYHANEHGFDADVRALAFQWLTMHLNLKK